MYDGTDTVVLFEELAYQEVLPLAWRAGELPVKDQLLNHGRNAKLLQLCLALEEHAPLEKMDERSAMHVDLLRMDLKINLLLELVGRLMSAAAERPPALPLRFNAMGAIWPHQGQIPVMGEWGTLEVYLRDCLVDPLRLYGQVVVHEETLVKVKFANLSEPVIDQLEKLSFRRHRRLVAGSRSSPRTAF